MTSAHAIVQCSEHLKKRRRVRLLMSDDVRLSVVREGIAEWDRCRNQVVWMDKMKARLRGEPYEFNPAFVWFIVQLVLPILLNWIIDHYFEGSGNDVS